MLPAFLIVTASIADTQLCCSYVGHGDVRNKHGLGICYWPEPAAEKQTRKTAVVPQEAAAATELNCPDGEVPVPHEVECRFDNNQRLSLQVYYGCWQDNIMTGHGSTLTNHIKAYLLNVCAGVLTWFDGDVYLGQFQQGAFHG
jgi:hypothetical protein